MILTVLHKIYSYDFQPTIPSDNVMHQIAEIKLLHISKALGRGVNIMILDLDVAFLQSPMTLVRGFFESPYEQARTQTDIGYVQEWRPQLKNSSIYGSWYTTPRANFGLYLVKAHPLSVKSFKCGWKNYLKIDKAKQALVAIDQNCLVGCIKFQRYLNHYNFSVFSLGFLLDVDPLPRQPQKVLLLDKIEHRKEWNGMSFELGGSIAKRELGDAVAIHGTCYEQYTKLLVLKAANAFYSAPYYDPERLTITKPLMYLTRQGLIGEIKALAFLAVHSGRTIVLPNILIG
jgi:Nucleotide-diphospho-sugar transferase